MVYSKTLAATVLVASVPQAIANLYLTAPVASTTCTANQQCQVAWNDDGKSPALAAFGVCNVGVFVGSQTTQYLLQDLGSVDVAQTASAQFTPNAAIGANSNSYFLRFTSINGKDAANPQYPIQGFSAKFTLAGMTGTFNATEQAAIDAGNGSTGGTNSAAGGQTTAPASQSSPTSTQGSPTSTTASADSTNTSNAAGARVALGSTQSVIAVALTGLTAVIASLVF